MSPRVGYVVDENSRRIAWNSTLLLSGVFGILAGAMPNFVSFVSLLPHRDGQKLMCSVS